MRLTPAFLQNQNKFQYPSIIISLLNNKFIVNTISKDGGLSGESEFSIPGDYLLINEIQSHNYIKEPDLQTIDNALWYAEKAFKSLRVKDWNSFGINLDLCFGLERPLLEINSKLDLIYSTARISGAIGGYSSENKLFLVCPKDKKSIIEKGTYDAIRNYG